MIAEIGLYSLLIALLFAILLVTIPLIGLSRANFTLQNTANYYAFGQFLFTGIAYLCLTLAFLQNDFTVSYVLYNSSLSLPWFYKLCAVWGGHEGSMLLWLCILNLWLMAICLFSKSLEHKFRVRVLIVMGALSIGFLLFILYTSNPFLRQFQLLNTEGRDLNPLLQDPGFLFHPPMLYMGYVGFSVAFAFAIATLWSGNFSSDWVKWTRPWTLAAWCFLTTGITLGSWWAYRELGWGGWWFWDPVENVSFMPWLVGTALIHCLAVTEQRKQFTSWTLLLAITAFSLSLVGTFLVRSGVLTSVHAFAVDPQRGLFILAFLIFVIGGSLLLFALRAQSLQKYVPLHLFARESVLLLNNVFLSAAMLSILLGTLYPLLIDALGLGKLSVGAPYFNSVFAPLMIPVLALMGTGIHLRWQQDDWRICGKKLITPAILSGLMTFFFMVAYQEKLTFTAFIGLLFALWIITSTGKLLLMRGLQRGFSALPQTFWGMIIAHLGIAITTIGIVISSSYGLQDDMRMKANDRVQVGPYTVEFVAQEALHGPNYYGTRAQFFVTDRNNQQFILYPEKRIYKVAQMAMTESAINANLFRDLYIALGEPLAHDSWSIRFYYKPLIRWIWGGGFMILLGGLVALTDRRYFVLRKKSMVIESVTV